MRLVGERTIRELGSFPVGCPEVRLEEITFDSTRYRPTQFWANDEQPGSYQLAGRVSTDKRASRHSLLDCRQE